MVVFPLSCLFSGVHIQQQNLVLSHKLIPQHFSHPLGSPISRPDYRAAMPFVRGTWFCLGGGFAILVVCQFLSFFLGGGKGCMVGVYFIQF